MDNKEYRDFLAQEFSATGETGYADAVHGCKDDPIIDAALNAMRRAFNAGNERGWTNERKRCANIAEAVDSGRGNEKMIAAAIRN